MRGAYITEKISFVLIQNCWSQFLNFMEIKAQQSIIDLLKESIKKTRDIKLKAFENEEHELVGINLFANKSEQNNSWSNVPKYLEFDYLIFEREKYE